jgi:hypothetical protein
MKTLRNPGKVDLILGMFPEVGANHAIEDVLAVTGIPNYVALKSMLYYIRKGAKVPDENRIDVRLKQGMCVRVN